MTQSASAASISNPLFEKSKRPFLWRKLFSLCGVMPIAGYTAFHLWENAKALQGRQQFIDMVGDIGKMPYLTALEICVIIVPICIHATIGTKILLDARYNVGAYSYSGNWSFTLQRLTALLVAAFLIYHLWELRVQKLIVGMDGGGFYDTLCRNMSSTVSGVPIIALVYILGIGAVAFHLANGLWGFLFSWGITVSRRSQRLSASLAGLIGLLVFLLGANTAVYFATGSKIFVPSEWFTPTKPHLEGCPASVLNAPPAGDPMPSLSAPKPATSSAPATR
ncbi:MAG: succinate dehydrogenase [Deltaproteobacteria bacterium]|nr:succinate dehydrogenase [Deltaproteobacteria bacterium]